jgi:hypothetical protein
MTDNEDTNEYDNKNDDEETTDSNDDEEMTNSKDEKEMTNSKDEEEMTDSEDEEEMTDSEDEEEMTDSEDEIEEIEEEIYESFTNNTFNGLVKSSSHSKINQCVMVFQSEYGLKKSNIESFVKNGWDINSLYKYPNDTNEKCTLLISCSEWRNYDDMKCLLELGADPNIFGSCKFNALANVLFGHNPGYLNMVDECLECVKLLQDYGCLLQIHKTHKTHMKEEVFIHYQDNKQLYEIINQIEFVHKPFVKACR